MIILKFSYEFRIIIWILNKEPIKAFVCFLSYSVILTASITMVIITCICVNIKGFNVTTSSHRHSKLKYESTSISYNHFYLGSLWKFLRTCCWLGDKGFHGLFLLSTHDHFKYLVPMNVSSGGILLL